jgi:hypothetical protein
VEDAQEGILSSSSVPERAKHTQTPPPQNSTYIRVSTTPGEWRDIGRQFHQRSVRRHRRVTTSRRSVHARGRQRSAHAARRRRCTSRERDVPKRAVLLLLLFLSEETRRQRYTGGCLLEDALAHALTVAHTSAQLTGLTTMAYARLQCLAAQLTAGLLQLQQRVLTAAQHDIAFRPAGRSGREHT